MVLGKQKVRAMSFPPLLFQLALPMPGKSDLLRRQFVELKGYMPSVTL